MSVTLVVEDGSGLTNSNSYVTLADADEYHDKRLHNSVWEQHDDEDKERALMWATQLLDLHCRWKGERVSTGQALEWPRSGVNSRDYDDVLASDAIPQWLKDATSELARNLLAKDRPAEAENQRVRSTSTRRGSRSMGPPDLRHLAVLPPLVKSMVAPFVRMHTFRLERV